MTSQTLDLDALTPDDHVRTLVELAQHFENANKHFIRNGAVPNKGITATYAKRAAAIRWILAETAYPIEENTPV